MDKSTRRAAMLIASLASFFAPFMVASFNVALPSIGAEFSASAIQLSWLATAFPLSIAIALLPFGRAADINGRKRIFTIGAVVFVVATIVAMLSQSAALLVMARMTQGVGQGMMFGTVMAILVSVFPVEERGRVLGINVAIVYSGHSMGPLLGGLLTQLFGWRSIFAANLPISIMMLLALPKLRGEWAEARGQRFDFAGSVIYGLGLATIIYGLSLMPSPTGGFLIVGGVLCIFAFLQWEMRTPSPLLDVKLFRKNTTFIFSSLAALISYSATAAVTFLLSLYLQYTKGLSPGIAGLVLVSQPLVQVLVSPFAGRLSDRVEPRLVSSAGMAVNCVGLSLLSLIGENTPVALIVVYLLIMGLGFGLFSSPNTNAIMSSVDSKSYGVASASVGTMRTVGQMLSLGIAMVMFAVFMGHVKIEPQYYPQFLTSVRAAFAIFAFLCFLGVFASMARGRLHRTDLRGRTPSPPPG